ncbi:CoA transferase [Sphingosinicellaceae bacterium]|nr:CoA transferase [Sphingosinicellaceae bacterium]
MQTESRPAGAAESFAVDRPLAGIRVVDGVRGPLAAITRYLAELGATVDRVVPADPADPFADIAANIGKRSFGAAIDSPAAQPLIAAAHAIVVEAGQCIDLAALRRERPALVTMTVSDFGTGNPISGWQATDPVLHALSGELSRSGIRGQPPLLPPGELAYQCAASQAAFALVAALYNALRTGVGDHIDYSALDGAVQALDPGYGINGSATMGRPAHLLSRDRPSRGFSYPILRCADGHVRICILAPRQWLGMFRWMGEPAAFADPAFAGISHRNRSPELMPAIAAFIAEKTRAELEAEGERRGVPIAAVLTFAECMATEHMRARHAFTEARRDDGTAVTLPNGVVTVEGERLGIAPTPTAAATEPDWSPLQPATARIFTGLRVLDLGVIVVGAEQSRLLADLGADVIKVESQAFPDGSRQSYLSYGMSISFVTGHRNKRSLGLNLRDPAGHALFLELAKKADVILSNYKPGTLKSLGLDHEQIAAINPAIVMADSSAFGATGPWSTRMGYGPLVRAVTGLATAWRYPDDPEGFCDSVTVYPDHVAARIGAMAAVALLIRRLRTGRGGTASIAQSEVMLAHFAADAARLSQGQPTGGPPDWPWQVYPTSGDDEWCVVTVRGGADWSALDALVGVGGDPLDTPVARLAARDRIDAALGPWLLARTADAAMTELQAAGVPAARMLRVADLPDFAYFRERGLFRTEAHPFLPDDFLTERWHVPSLTNAEPPTRPAPLAGEDTAEVVADWLGLDPAKVEALIAAGVIEPLAEDVRAAAEAARRV